MFSRKFKVKKSQTGGTRGAEGGEENMSSGDALRDLFVENYDEFKGEFDKFD